jgi:peptidoglycan/LPS O-acetylase OafA/YrhL
MTAIAARADVFHTDFQRKLYSRNIPALDGLRAVAVGLVFLDHYTGVEILGHIGVLMFFVLSGFLITWLLLYENDKRGAISLSAFYQRRLLRIFPAFYVFWFVYLCGLILMHMDVPWKQLFSAFFYVSNYYWAINNPPVMAMPHTWSLAIEEQFYIFWPMLFVNYRHNLRRLTWILVGMIVTAWFYRIVLHSTGVSSLYIFRAFDTRLDHLMAGCLLAILHKQGLLLAFWRAICRSAWSPVVTASLLACSMAASARWPVKYLTTGFALDPLIIAVLMTQLISLSTGPGWIWLNSPLMRYLGRISYPLYLYHGLSRDVVLRLLPRSPLPLVLAAGLVISVIVATCSYYAVERPFLMLKERIRYRAYSRQQQQDLASCLRG